jgi:AcrR family transcriptional regulator
MSGLSENELLGPVPQGRYAKGVIKREAILDAALQVFSQVGFQGSTLREIARKCGVSHQSLMHYFPSKQELLIAVLHRRDERLRRHFNDPSGMAVGELIALAEYNASAPGHIELFSAAAAEATAVDHPGHQYYAQFYRSLVSSMTTYLTIAEQHGMLKPGISPEVASRVLLALVDGLQLQWLYERDSVKVAEIIRSVFGGLLTVDVDELEKLKKE